MFIVLIMIVVTFSFVPVFIVIVVTFSFVPVLIVIVMVFGGEMPEFFP